MKLMRRLVIRAFGEVKEYDLTTTIEQIENMKKYAEDFDVLEYREELCEQ